MHSSYTPALAPSSTTLNISDVDDKNTELTLVTTLDHDEHPVEDTTNADESLLAFTRPAPTTEIHCTVPITAGITLGVSVDTDTIANGPAVK